MKLDITYDIDDSRVTEVLASGLDTGIAYWAEITGASLGDDFREAGYYTEVKDVEGNQGDVFRINLQAIRRGLTVMSQKSPRHFKDLVEGEIDQVTGDVLVQCICFGEVVYG